MTPATATKWNAEMTNCLTRLCGLGLKEMVLVFQLSSVCAKYEDKLRGFKSFTSAFITGSRNVISSAFKEHTNSEMHKQAMRLLERSKSTYVNEYVPIAKALTTLDPTTEARLKKKFDLAYFLAKENLSFRKFVPITELEERHDVDIGVSYRNDKATAEFVSYIAKTYCKDLESVLSSIHF